MPNFNEVRHLLDKFFPHGAKREIWWVTQESLDNNSCNACGRCCAMIGFTYSIEQMERIFLKDPDANEDSEIRFIVDNMATIPEKESVARGGDGGGARFVCCSRLAEDGLCSVHDDKPSFCQRHPVLGQSVLKECAFAGVDDYEKSPRGREQARLSKLPVYKTKYEVELEDGPTPN